ncbi:hypothetical protein DSO57_1006614 [Entomophthora muscae]|uniref:Uncharacterized protein n=1 Tax=Entomophthora muscae TaxID=34485 RepID=A0ACC2T7C9_9FUNG|nr:hypothetical protein DSO57_1006614 [Entomophthora muscae]
MNLWFNQVIPYLILVLFHLQTNFCDSVSPIYSFQETTDQLPKLYCLLEAPFGLVHFTEYPPNLEYLEFTPEEILIHNPEARTKETETVYREEIKVIILHLLFRNKYNYLPAYLVLMTPPLTLRPNCSQKSVTAKEFTSTQIFGVMYITLTGLIDSMIPVSRPWALMGKFISFIVKLAPILWWALPAGPAGWPPASSQELSQGGSLTGLIDSALLMAGPWGVAGKALFYLIKLGLIIWWAMPASALTPSSPAEAPWYSWYSDILDNIIFLYALAQKRILYSIFCQVSEVAKQHDTEFYIV